MFPRAGGRKSLQIGTEVSDHLMPVNSLLYMLPPNHHVSGITQPLPCQSPAHAHGGPSISLALFRASRAAWWRDELGGKCGRGRSLEIGQDVLTKFKNDAMNT